MVVLTDYIRKALSFLRTCMPERQEPESIKLKASTLIESLVASVIIIVVFSIASLTLSNVFQSSIKNNTDRVQNRMNTLEYLYLHNKIVYPYREDFEDWNIQLKNIQENNVAYILLEATQLNPDTGNAKIKKNISRKLTYDVSQ